MPPSFVKNPMELQSGTGKDNAIVRSSRDVPKCAAPADGLRGGRMHTVYAALYWMTY